MANTLELGNGKWATGKDTVLAFNDENNNFKPLPFSFSRDTSGTVVNKDGLIETVGVGEPRIDFKDNTKGALLLEPQRSNLLTYSEDFTTGWSNLISGSGVNPVVTSNQGISPDGSLNADRVVFDLNGGNSSSDYSLLDYSLSGFSNPHTLDTSIYLKSSDGNDYQVAIYNRGTSVQIITVTNQWQRFSVNGTRSNTTNNFRIGLFGNTSSNTASLLLFGSQAEQGSYATSYIPTSGSAVTRVAESSSQTVPDGVIGQTEGVVYTELNMTNLSTKFIFSLDDGGASDFIILDTNSVGELDFQVRQSSGSITTLINGNALNVGINKVAVKYKSGDYSLYLNGTLQGTSSSTLFPSGVISRISVGANSSYGYLSDTVKNVKLYDTALTDQELIALTQ